MKITDRRMLPRGGLSVPVFGLGGAQLGGLYRAMSDGAAAALFDAAWNLGVRHFDTAPYYGYTRSEHRLGSALGRRPRDEFILSTKVGRLFKPDASVRPGDDGWTDPLPFRPRYDYSRDGVMRSIDDSLQRLGIAQVDLLYVHDIGTVAHGERHREHWKQLTRGGGFRALEALGRSGVTRAVGLGVNEWQVAQASMREFDLDCTMLVGRYTLLEQAALSPLLDECLARGNAIVVAGPFNSGVLAGGQQFQLHRGAAQRDRARAHAGQRVPRVRRAAAGCGIAVPARPPSGGVLRRGCPRRDRAGSEHRLVRDPQPACILECVASARPHRRPRAAADAMSALGRTTELRRNFSADMAAIAADADTQRWRQFCGPCQVPLPMRQSGEHWAPMEQVFHVV